MLVVIGENNYILFSIAALRRPPAPQGPKRGPSEPGGQWPAGGVQAEKSYAESLPSDAEARRVERVLKLEPGTTDLAPEGASVNKLRQTGRLKFGAGAQGSRGGAAKNGLA